MASGAPSLPLYAVWDPDSSSWRTSQPSLLDDPDSTSSSLTLPKSGMTSGGRVYGLPTLERVTGGSAGSQLPTPLTSDSNGTTAGDTQLRGIAELLPTPTSRDHKGAVDPASRDRTMGSLDEAVEFLLPSSPPQLQESLTTGNPSSPGKHGASG